MLKIDSWPQAIVLITGTIAAAAVLVFLVMAGWSEGGIAAFVTMAVGQLVGFYVQTRKTAVVEAKTDQQSTQLAVIRKQTNGRSAAELQDVAERAVKTVLAAQNASDKRVL